MSSNCLRLRSQSRWFCLLLLGSLLAAAFQAAHAEEHNLAIDVPKVVLRDIPFELSVKDSGGSLPDGTEVTVTSDGRGYTEALSGGEAKFAEVTTASGAISASATSAQRTIAGDVSANVLPGWVAILPALVAIIIALAVRQVIPALFLGVWLGGSLVYGLGPSGAWHGLLDTFTTYTLKALNDTGHLSVILFSLMIGGMVGVISKNGGTAGIVDAIRPVLRIGIAMGELGALAALWSVHNRGTGSRHILRRLCQHSDRRQHDASDQRSTQSIPREARLHRRLHCCPRGDYRTGYDVDRFPSGVDRLGRQSNCRNSGICLLYFPQLVGLQLLPHSGDFVRVHGGHTRPRFRAHAQSGTPRSPHGAGVSAGCSNWRVRLRECRT